MFSCEVCEISKNTFFFHKTHLVAASEIYVLKTQVIDETTEYNLQSTQEEKDKSKLLGFLQ